VKPGARFALFAFERVTASKHFTKKLPLAADLEAHPGPPFPLDDVWRGWLGTLQSRRYEKSNLAFLAWTTPGDGRDENDCERRAYSLVYSLLLQGRFVFGDGLILKGPVQEDGPHITAVSWPPAFKSFVEVRPMAVGASHLRKGSAIADGLMNVYEPGAGYARVRRGFAAWLRSVREDFLDVRLHQCVRAVEALLKPSIGKSRAQFGYRSQAFLGPSPAARRLAERLYDLRSAAEHMNDWMATIKKREDATRRAYQAEYLAAWVYRRLLTTPALLAAFSSDAAIEVFWTGNERSWRRAWAPQLSLPKAASRHYRRFS